jgi:ABC-type glycerol-3-phosphate transport system permease component
VATAAATLALVLGALAGLVIALGSTVQARCVTAVAAVGLLVPPTSLVLGCFVIFRQLHLLDSYAALVLPPSARANCPSWQMSSRMSHS